MTVRSPSFASVFSWITIASAPAGTGPPVKMRTVSPGPTLPSKASPAGASPMTLRVAGVVATSVARTA